MEYLRILYREGITEVGVLPLSKCRMIREYLLGKTEADIKSVIAFLIPYYTGEGENISAYAISMDYHFYMNELFLRICPQLQKAYPDHRFFGFSDHSPIDERELVLETALAMKGENRLLIHEKYGTYFFVAEVFTTLPPEVLGYVEKKNTPSSCLQCGACRRACPGGALAGTGVCLSAVTQKKGILDESEREMIKKSGCAWGCDVCQQVCPYNHRAEKTPIEFFYRERLPRLTAESIRTMDEETFSRRAYSWRGRETILRNLKILEE